MASRSLSVQTRGEGSSSSRLRYILSLSLCDECFLCHRERERSEQLRNHTWQSTSI